MKYFLDTEFNGFGGAVISLALVPENGGDVLYICASDMPDNMDQWVAENVIPIIDDSPEPARRVPVDDWCYEIGAYLNRDIAPEIIADWPDDIKYFCKHVISGPGEMVNIPSLRFEVVRVDAYPSDVCGAVQHNALWDAIALRDKITGGVK